MSSVLRKLAHTAVAGCEGHIGVDTLNRVKIELSILQTALRNDEMPLNRHDAADMLCMLVDRIELAMALAEPESEAAE